MHEAGHLFVPAVRLTEAGSATALIGGKLFT
jgi:hypothetical protein